MAIAKKIIKYLEDNKIKYEVVEHRKVFTALDSACTQRLKPNLVVKTLVMKIDKGYGLALLPAGKNLDKAKFKKATKAKSVDFAKEPWMKKNVMGKVGATPAFGKLLKLPVYMDAALYKNKELILNTGEYTQSFIVKTNQFVKLEEPRKAVFSKAKK
ncbi:MAG: YbaK/EbsC family protein [Patescibacteria group bacterium]|jgi:prolyl-tRNA editing enzyme YbaK/EbsC (Cys-tRNA(Pro) deacylase)